jgi:signal transduction histidine kinase
MTSVSIPVRMLKRFVGESEGSRLAEESAAGGSVDDVDDVDAALRDVALHNLRTPLSVAEGAVTLLRDHGDRLTPEQRADLFASIDSAHQRIRQMAESALADRYGPSDGEARPADVKPRDIVDSVIVDLRDAGPVHLLGVVDDAVPSSFAGNPRTVRDALENLVTNAIKFTPEGGTISVLARSHGREVSFSVSDTGCGVPANELDHVFDKYWQGTASERRGLGVGLFISRAIVEAHGGRMWASSLTGKGSTFCFTLPTYEAAARNSELGAGTEAR